MPDNDLHHDQGPTVAALVADLIFASRIRGPAPGAVTAHSADRLAAALSPSMRLVLIDLHARGALDAIPRVRSAAPTATIVAFGSHVETATLQAAREAGADRVMARSALVRELPSLVDEAEARNDGS